MLLQFRWLFYLGGVLHFILGILFFLLPAKAIPPLFLPLPKMFRIPKINKLTNRLGSILIALMGILWFIPFKLISVFLFSLLIYTLVSLVLVYLFAWYILRKNPDLYQTFQKQAEPEELYNLEDWQ